MPRRSWQSFRIDAEILVRRQDRGADPRLVDLVDAAPASGMSAGLCSSISSPSVMRELVDDRRRGRDQVEVELALQPLLDDLEVQQAEEAAAEAEAERGRGLHLVGEAGVVEAQLAHRGAQVLELGGVDREEAAEHHRLRRLEAGQRLGGRAACRR